MVRDSIVYVSILLMTLIFMIQSNAKIDPKSAAGVWLFDEESGKVAKDSSDNGYDGMFMGKGNPKWVEGKFGKALDFNSDGRVVSAATPELHREVLALLNA